ncbi:cation diffusion facilitator family transporter [Pseudonocardia oroxyli]|uniref:Cobalt-zinc-cadmium efflux system protein n=1 Tax=Pseudonocardia oroxyli TaxID=366584 RepID=A0A1G7LLP6_PSEOR|nr:cation diffusion facilitator family transporter [Pseudonocardia oroxyli]SDF50284.1 cobalt-zinc-cadmium efflux system protein [Pseudonocardia oroxyli]
MGSGHGHGHGHSVASDRRRLVIALVVTLACAVLGAAGALLTGSLALLADLGHLLTDAGALVGAVIAAALSTRPATDRRTFGLGRVEVLVAGINAALLVAVVAWVAYEGVNRLFEPAEIPGLPLLVIGALGLVGNVVSLVVLAGGDRANMNMRGAMLHVLGDALGSVGVMLAAVVLLTTGWPYADTLASMLIAALILPRAIALLREVWHVLLEGAPAGIEVDEVRTALLAVPGVEAVHDLHVWAINDRTPSLSAHLVVADEAESGCGAGVLDRATEALKERFGLTHSTLQLEPHAHVGHEHTCD